MDSIPHLVVDTWIFVGLMGAIAFIAALLGSLIAFRTRFVGAIIAGVLFAARHRRGRGCAGIERGA